MEKFCILISTCDLYSDCWEPMLFSIRKYWPDCPYPIYFITNHKKVEDDGVVTIMVGDHLGWGSNTKKALSQLDFDYFLYLQEDFFLNRPVNTVGVRENFDFCVKNDIDYLRVMAPYKDKYPYNENYSYDAEVRSKTKLHAMNLMAVIWKKAALQKLCVEGWTGWDYERKVLDYIKDNKIKINKLVINTDKQPTLGIPVMDSTGIRKGIWTREGYDFLIENGFKKEAAGRKVEGKFLTWCMNQKHPLIELPCAIMVRIIQKFQ